MPDSTTPAQFNPIFRQGVPIIGGHAVNLWATYYSARGEPDLIAFEPFISKDGDIYLKDPDIAVAVAAAAGWRFDRNPEPRSAVLGVITLEREGVRLDVHVMRVVNGLSESDLTKTELLTLKDGTAYCLPAPDVMLKAKLSNLYSFDQKRGVRQDERHVRILVACNRQYLADTFRAVADGKMSEREAVDRFTESYRVISSSQARALDRTFRLKLASSIPSRESLGDLAQRDRIRAFYDHQLGRLDRERDYER